MKNKFFKDIPDQRKIQSKRGLKRINESIFDEYTRCASYNVHIIELPRRRECLSDGYSK